MGKLTDLLHREGLLDARNAAAKDLPSSPFADGSWPLTMKTLEKAQDQILDYESTLRTHLETSHSYKTEAHRKTVSKIRSRLDELYQLIYSAEKGL